MPTRLLTGSLKLGADPGSAVEVNDEITAFRIIANATDITVPAVFSTGVEGHLMGPSNYQLGLSYLVNPQDADGVSNILLDAIMSGDPVYYQGTFFPGPVSASNKQYSGYFIPTSTNMGGDVGTLMSDSQTFPCTERPVIYNGVTSS